MKILMVSLGCDKNLVDSERMLGMFADKGYTFTDDEEEADIVVINTCCFIHDAKEESVNTILEFAERRKMGQLKALVITGCLAQRYYEEMQKEIKEVDAVVGTASAERIVEALESVLHGTPTNFKEELGGEPFHGNKRILTTGGHYAYLKIAEGCDKHCTYCIIPKIRGAYRSIPMESLLSEAKQLAAQGVKELILIAQETTIYGSDLYGKKCLPDLLRQLCTIPEFQFIRILYCYPEEVDLELIQVIKEEKKICKYLDLPIQHASDDVLKRMGRRTNQEELRKVISLLRNEIPDICLRTTLITGFPGETQEDHEELYRFVNEMEFDRLGVFTYSQEEDTPAATMENQIDEKIKEERKTELLELQQIIAFEKAEAMAGKVVMAMIEGNLTEDDVYIARTYKDAPNVDGYLFVKTDKSLMSGDIVRVRITSSHEYDLIGELEDEFTK